MTKKKIPMQSGDIVKIDLGDDSFCFGRVLEEPHIAFYDLKAIVAPDIQTIVALPILFIVWVMNNAVTSGRWPIIGNLPLDSELEGSPKFFKQDPINKTFSIYHRGQETSATLAECEKLERAAVWDPSHIEDRLHDYYSGVQNQWVESLKAK